MEKGEGTSSAAPSPQHEHRKTTKRPPVVEIKDEDSIASSNKLQHKGSSLLKRSGTFKRKLTPQISQTPRSSNHSRNLSASSPSLLSSTSLNPKKGLKKASSYLKGWKTSASSTYTSTTSRKLLENHNDNKSIYSPTSQPVTGALYDESADESPSNSTEMLSDGGMVNQIPHKRTSLLGRFWNYEKMEKTSSYASSPSSLQRVSSSMSKSSSLVKKSSNLLSRKRISNLTPQGKWSRRRRQNDLKKTTTLSPTPSRTANGGVGSSGSGVKGNGGERDGEIEGENRSQKVEECGTKDDQVIQTQSPFEDRSGGSGSNSIIRLNERMKQKGGGGGSTVGQRKMTRSISSRSNNSQAELRSKNSKRPSIVDQASGSEQQRNRMVDAVWCDGPSVKDLRAARYGSIGKRMHNMSNIRESNDVNRCVVEQNDSSLATVDRNMKSADSSIYSVQGLLDCLIDIENDDSD